MLQAVFEKHNSFLRPLKKKGFKEERVTTIGWYDIGKSHDPGIQQEPIQKSGIRNSTTYRLPNSRKSNFATEPLLPPPARQTACMLSGGPRRA